MITKISVRKAENSMSGVANQNVFNIQIPANKALKIAQRLDSCEDILQRTIVKRRKEILEKKAETDEGGKPLIKARIVWLPGHEKEGESFIEKHALKDSDGNVMIQSGGVKWKEGQEKEGEKELDELLNSEIEIPFPKVKFDVEEAKMSIKDALNILPFIEIVEIVDEPKRKRGKRGKRNE